MCVCVCVCVRGSAVAEKQYGVVGALFCWWCGMESGVWEVVVSGTHAAEGGR